jgi:hypothetical protein
MDWTRLCRCKPVEGRQKGLPKGSTTNPSNYGLGSESWLTDGADGADGADGVKHVLSDEDHFTDREPWLSEPHNCTTDSGLQFRPVNV